MADDRSIGKPPRVCSVCETLIENLTIIPICGHGFCELCLCNHFVKQKAEVGGVFSCPECNIPADWTCEEIAEWIDTVRDSGIIIENLTATSQTGYNVNPGPETPDDTDNGTPDNPVEPVDDIHAIRDALVNASSGKLTESQDTRRIAKDHEENANSEYKEESNSIEFEIEKPDVADSCVGELSSDHREIDDNVPVEDEALTTDGNSDIDTFRNQVENPDVIGKDGMDKKGYHRDSDSNVPVEDETIQALTTDGTSDMETFGNQVETANDNSKDDALDEKVCHKEVNSNVEIIITSSTEQDEEVQKGEDDTRTNVIDDDSSSYGTTFDTGLEMSQTTTKNGCQQVMPSNDQCVKDDESLPKKKEDGAIKVNERDSSEIKIDADQDDKMDTNDQASTGYQTASQASSNESQDDSFESITDQDINVPEKAPALLKVSDYSITFTGHCSPTFTGLAQLNKNLVIVCDNCGHHYACGHIGLFNVNEGYLSEIKMNKPFSACVLAGSESRVAVSVPNDNTIMVLSLDGKWLTRKMEYITQKKPLSLVSLCDGRLGITWQIPPSFEIVEIVEHEMKSVKLFTRDSTGRRFKSFRYIAVDESRNHVIQPCHVDNTVYCFTFSGEPVFAYKDPKLNGPYGVDVDRDGTIYICSRLNDTIHVVSPMGHKVNVISEGVPSCPQTLTFDPSGEQFWITAFDRYDIVSLYTIKH